MGPESASIGGQAKEAGFATTQTPKIGYMCWEQSEASNMDKHVSKDGGCRLALESANGVVRVEYNGQVIAESERALVLHESWLLPAYYFPMEDVHMEHLAAAEQTTLCAFKGEASYWDVRVGDKSEENAAWSYKTPDENVAGIAGHISFYWNLMDGWFLDGKPIQAPERVEAPTGVNPLAGWLMQEASGAESTPDLVYKFCRGLIEYGIPIFRFRLIIRTLHPQLFARVFTWSKGDHEISELSADRSIVDAEQFSNSPFAPILEGAGGVRRRLDTANPQLDYPVLKDLIEEGATDYVAMPLVFSDGQVNAFSISSERPGGFSTDDLGYIYKIIPIFSRLVEMHYLKRMAVTLLDTFLGQQTGERVMNGLVQRGDGEDIHAVIWFCDLRNSTPLSESMERKAYLDMLNQFLEAMADSVLEAGGEVLRFIGDAALAIFPIDEYDAGGRCEATGRAVSAARAAVGRMHDVKAERAKMGQDAIGYGIGLHFGDVTYGNIGSESRLEFTVIGPAANETARIESLTKTLDRTVLMSDEFRQCFPDGLVSMGRHALRGVAEEHELFTLP
jgi:adenylate cyclase